MRRSKVSAEEILQAEKAKDDRQRSRKNGYSMMHQRDAGWRQLSNGVVMLWPVDIDPSERFEGETWNEIPKGKFVLVTPDRTHHLFDAEEFRKWLRWV